MEAREYHLLLLCLLLVGREALLLFDLPRGLIILFLVLLDVLRLLRKEHTRW